MADRPTAVLAIGGNSLIRTKDKSSFADQLETVTETSRHIAALVESGWEVVVTHGNGPQVGFLLLRSHLSRQRLPEIPLDACNALTQAEVGYMIQQALGNELRRRGIDKGVATVVTQVIVDPSDPAFGEPSKPVGPFYTKAEANRLVKELGWHVREDAGRGFRRMVASPRPQRVVERDQIVRLLESGTVVVACGGGGIPVVETAAGLRGVAAVIDKDLASSLLAGAIGARRLVITTAVDAVYLNWGQPEQKQLGRVRAAEMERYAAAGHFAPGSMGPKVEAALDFLARGGEETIITDPEHLPAAMAGRAGTIITA